MNANLQTAIDFCRWLEPQLDGVAHVALTGGCLYRDGDRKDVDIVVYPHKSHILRDELYELVKGLFPEGRNPWGKDNNYPAPRLVWTVETYGLRVDFIFLT